MEWIEFEKHGKSRMKWKSNIFWIVIVTLNIPPSLLSSLMSCHLTNLCLKSTQIIFMRVSQWLGMFNEPTFEIWDYVYLWTCKWGEFFLLLLFLFLTELSRPLLLFLTLLSYFSPDLTLACTFVSTKPKAKGLQKGHVFFNIYKSIERTSLDKVG